MTESARTRRCMLTSDTPSMCELWPAPCRFTPRKYRRSSGALRRLTRVSPAASRIPRRLHFTLLSRPGPNERSLSPCRLADIFLAAKIKHAYNDAVRANRGAVGVQVEGGKSLMIDAPMLKVSVCADQRSSFER